MTLNHPVRSSAAISSIMRKVRSTDTTPETLLRKAIWKKGFRYRVNSYALPGKPDIVFPKKKLAIFIDGDFWHGVQWKKRGLRALEDQFKATASKEYWLRKIQRNIARDNKVTADLMAREWTVLRFWESDVRSRLEECVQMVIETVEHGTQVSPFALLPQRTFAEFFAGIGLARMGLEARGWTTLFANDIDPQKYEMYSANFKHSDQCFWLGDVHQLSAEQVPTVALASACFPCNDLSLAGARNGLAGRLSSAFWGFIRVIDEMAERRPPVVLLENVNGFLSSKQGKDFKEVLLALNRLGYSVDAFQINAVNFVPQSRPRLFVVGRMDGGGDGLGPDILQYAPNIEIRPKKLVEFIQSHPEIKWSIRDLPPPPERTSRLEDVLEDLEDSAPEWWSPERAEYLLNQMSPRHRAIANLMISTNRWSYGTVFRRVRHGKSMGELRTDGIAGCLRTPLGGSGRQILFKAGYGTYFARLLTPRECARLMGADDYRISVPLNQALYGFGDAVCVPVISWISRYYLEPLITESIRGRPLQLVNGHSEL